MRKSMVLVAALLLAPVLGAQSISFTCALKTCNDSAPANEWDVPSCDDEALNTSLIEAIERGDRSVLPIVRQRHESADTYQERLRLAKVLLKETNDAAIWKHFFDLANLAVRFPKNGDGFLTPEFEAYCEERGLDANRFNSVILDGLAAVMRDPRSRELLYRALKTSDGLVVGYAVTGLAEQGDSSALPAIKQALDRVAKDSPFVVMSLSLFESAEADALAFQYLNEDDRATYSEIRNASAEPR